MEFVIKKVGKLPKDVKKALKAVLPMYNKDVKKMIADGLVVGEYSILSYQDKDTLYLGLVHKDTGKVKVVLLREYDVVALNADLMNVRELIVEHPLYTNYLTLLEDRILAGAEYSEEMDGRETNTTLADALLESIEKQGVLGGVREFMDFLDEDRKLQDEEEKQEQQVIRIVQEIELADKLLNTCQAIKAVIYCLEKEGATIAQCDLLPCGTPSAFKVLFRDELSPTIGMAQETGLTELYTWFGTHFLGGE